MRRLWERWSSLSPTAQLLISVGLGTGVGLFFGERTQALQPLVDVYLRLLQMTVLPYLVCALVLGFGQLTPPQARVLGRRGGALLASSWLLALLLLLSMPLAFPTIESASFFSSHVVEPRHGISFAELYFTSNPFNALSNAVVPAVVLFSSVLGLGLMGLAERERVLGVLRVSSEAVLAVSRGVTRLNPVGVFAIVAVIAGSMTLETIQRLEVYFACFTVSSLLLTFWALPLLVTVCTPLRHREVAGVAREALLTAFLASSAFVVVPMLLERARVLLERHRLRNSEGDGAADVVVSVLLSFPTAGKLLTLLFVPFGAWVAGTAFGPLDAARLFVLGVPTYFAKAQVALPFLMDQFAVPQDLFQLYVPSAVLTGKLDSMVTAMNLLVFALIAGAAGAGGLALDRRRVLRAGVQLLAGGAVVVAVMAGVLRAAVDTDYRDEGRLARMTMHRDASNAQVDHVLEADKLPPRPGGALERVRAFGELRVGYDADNVPFSFFNAQGQLVGFDVELSLALAESLGVRAHFVPVTFSEAAARLADGSIDVMPGIWYRPFWFRTLRLSAPYLTETMGFAVLDARRGEFESRDELRQRSGLRIGVNLDTSQYMASIAQYFGGSDARFVTADPRAFFKGLQPELDAFLLPVEGAAAWTLRYPRYSVVVPQPDPVTVPVAFGVARGADDLAVEIDEWVTFALSEGLMRRAREQWILGKDARSRVPRWSVLGDLLGVHESPGRGAR